MNVSPSIHGWGDFAYSLEIDPGMHDYWETGVLGIRRQDHGLREPGWHHALGVGGRRLCHPGPRNRLLAAGPSAHSLHRVGLQDAGTRLPGGLRVGRRRRLAQGRGPSGG